MLSSHLLIRKAEALSKLPVFKGIVSLPAKRWRFCPVKNFQMCSGSKKHLRSNCGFKSWVKFSQTSCLAAKLTLQLKQCVVWWRCKSSSWQVIYVKSFFNKMEIPLRQFFRRVTGVVWIAWFLGVGRMLAQLQSVYLVNRRSLALFQHKALKEMCTVLIEYRLKISALK